MNQEFLCVKKLLPLAFQKICKVRFEHGNPSKDSFLANAIRRSSKKGVTETTKSVYLLDFDNYTSMVKCTEFYTLYVVAALSVCQIIFKLALQADELSHLHAALRKEEIVLRYKAYFLTPFLKLKYYSLLLLQRNPGFFLNTFLENKFTEEYCHNWAVTWGSFHTCDLSNISVQVVESVMFQILA